MGIATPESGAVVDGVRGPKMHGIGIGMGARTDVERVAKRSLAWIGSSPS